MLNNFLCYWFKPSFNNLDFIFCFLVIAINSHYKLTFWPAFEIGFVYVIIKSIIIKKYKIRIIAFVEAATEKVMLE